MQSVSTLFLPICAVSDHAISSTSMALSDEIITSLRRELSKQLRLPMNAIYAIQALVTPEEIMQAEELLEEHPFGSDQHHINYQISLRVQQKANLVFRFLPILIQEVLPFEDKIRAAFISF